eukprot:g13805.t1
MIAHHHGTFLFEETHHAHRGLILRQFSAEVGGRREGPTFSLIGADHFGQRTLGLELGAGSAQHFQADIVARVVYCCSVFLFLPVQAGDTISGEVELLLYPKKESVYYGRAALQLQNDWELVFRETQLEVHVLEGQLQRKHPLRLLVNARGQAEFNFSIPANYSGMLPVTIAGVEGLQGCLQHFQHEVCKAEFEGGEFQVDYIMNEGYSYTYRFLELIMNIVFQQKRPKSLLTSQNLS